MIWMVFVVLGLSYILFHYEGKAVRESYSEIYRNKMLITTEYTRRVISDVYVAVTHNIYYIEHTLDKPDLHKGTMERIVKSGTRVRSCGISFIEDYYYPQKERHFCPFAWRNITNPDVIYSQDMGDADLDYLTADWFLDILKSDSAQWSEPFYDGYDNKTALSAYMVPIHDQEGRVVAVLGADVSLDWLTNKIIETDSVINQNSMFLANKFKMKSYSFIINHDGSYLTHSDESNILKGNFYSQLASSNGSDVKALVKQMEAGVASDNKSFGHCVFNGEECYIFYIPVKYTRWLMVTVVPCHAIDMLGYIKAGTVTILILLAMLLLLVVIHYYMKNAIEPLKQLTQVTDDINNGHFDTPIPELKHNDELSQLRDSIQEMQFKLSNT
ncbi:MAG: HAMP domain-containing protein [Prevotella sp.]|nr:HAMP domain-containing protein [Prevotella sp.]